MHISRLAEPLNEAPRPFPRARWVSEGLDEFVEHKTVVAAALGPRAGDDGIDISIDDCCSTARWVR